MLPLSGVRVVDVSRLLPGPMCTWYLQGMGAEVVKIEPPGTGDYLRHVPPYGPDGVGAWFTAINGGKRSVVLDLRQGAAVEALAALLVEADVLVEGFRPGVLAAMGLPPAQLRERHPGLVICSISGYGQDGPFEQLPGHDLGYVAMAGLFGLPARHGGLPALPALQLADMAGGALTAALRICAALYHRERTGEGAWLDVSMTDGVVALMAPTLTEVAISGRDPVPGGGALTGGVANYQLYRCSDGELLAFPPLEPKFWARFQAALGEDLPMDIEVIEARFATRPRDEWVALLAEACVVPALTPREVLEHPLHRARGTVVGEGREARVRPPFPDAPAPAPAPALGAHSRAVLEAAGVDTAGLLGGAA